KQFWVMEGTDWGKSHYLTALMRFFSCDILGTGNYFKGWRNYLEAPLFYCGLISLVLFPHFLNLSDKRKKIIYFAFILVFVLPVIFPFFRYAFWLFTGNYYRIFPLFVALAILLIALKSIDHINSASKTNIKITLATLLFLVFLLYYPYDNAKIIDHHIRNIVVLFIITYSVLIYIMQFKRIKNYVKIILLFIIAIELICFSGITVNKRPVMSHKETTMKVGYNDYTVNALHFIKSADKSFFRISKDYSSGTAMHKSINDAAAQDFYGTPSYHSFNQINYVNFLKEMNIMELTKEQQTRWNRGLVGWPLLHSFASVKYALTKDQSSNLLHFGYYPIASFGDVQILQNKFALPLGFTYERYISLKDFQNLSQDQKILVLYKAAVIDDLVDENIKKLTKLDIKEIPADFSLKDYAQDIELIKKDSLVISRHGQNTIKGQINSAKDKILFFSIPFDKGWKIKVDGEIANTMMVNIGFIGVPIKKGFHQIELSFTPLYYYTAAYLSLISFFLFICLITFKNLKYRKG
ncbi:MAG: YfhO family protein, partial [Smithella sp.]